MAFGHGPYYLKHKQPTHCIVAEFNAQHELNKKYGPRIETINIPYSWHDNPTDPWEQLRAKKVKDCYRLTVLRRNQSPVVIGDIDEQGTLKIRKPECYETQRFLGYTLMSPRSKTFEHMRFRFNHHVHSDLSACQEGFNWFKVRTDKPIYISREGEVFQKHPLKKRIFNKKKNERLKKNVKVIEKKLNRMDKLTDFSSKLDEVLKENLANHNMSNNQAVKNIQEFFNKFMYVDHQEHVYKAKTPMELLSTTEEILLSDVVNIFKTYIMDKIGYNQKYLPGYWQFSGLYNKVSYSIALACEGSYGNTYYPNRSMEQLKQKLGIVKYKEVN